jgi:hypothetical protein
MIYEYVDKAGPRTFAENGSRPMPIFFSAQFLNHEDSYRVYRLFRALKKSGEDGLDAALTAANEEIKKHATDPYHQELKNPVQNSEPLEKGTE